MTLNYSPEESSSRCIITVLAPRTSSYRITITKQKKKDNAKSSVTLVLLRGPDHRTTAAHACPAPFDCSSFEEFFVRRRENTT